MAEQKKWSISDLVVIRDLFDKASDADTLWGFVQSINGSEVALVGIAVGVVAGGVRKLWNTRHPP